MIRVIIVDDHAVVRQGLCRAISAHADLEVVGEASSGRQAVDFVGRESVDVVVLDISMRDGDGLDAARKISRRKKNAPRIVMLSMHDGEEYARRAAEAGALGYVDKGAGIDELADAIRSVHRGERYVSSRIIPLGAMALDDLESLTRRERQVLISLAEGQTNHEIATSLGISVKTVDTHRGHMLRKLALRNNSDVTRFAIQNGLISVPGGQDPSTR